MKSYLREHCDKCDLRVDQIESVGDDGDNGVITVFTCPKCKNQWSSSYEFINRSIICPANADEAAQ